MENIKQNRLRFVHCDTLFSTRDSAMDYVNGNLSTIQRPSLYAEPMVLKYGNETNPNILLAIGSVGDGVTQSQCNKVFFIDFAYIKEQLNKCVSENNKNKVIVNDSDSISHNLVTDDNGSTLISNIKLAEENRFGNKVFENNIIKNTKDGLWASVEVSEGQNSIQFNINGVVTDIPNLHLQSGEYSRKKEALILKLNNGQEVEIPMIDLIEEWGVLDDSKQQSPVVLTKTHKIYTELTHSEEYKDILQADLRISKDKTNIAKIDDSYSLYVQAPTLDYNINTNTLTFDNGIDKHNITLIDSSYEINQLNNNLMEIINSLSERVQKLEDFIKEINLGEYK